MIDTIDIRYDIPNLDLYNRLYEAVDKKAREVSSNKLPLHKEKKENCYKTSVFCGIGILEIGFQKHKKYQNYAIRVKMQPIRMLYPHTQTKLSSHFHFPKISERFRHFLYSLDLDDAISEIPPLEEWSTTRIDYAMDLHSPYVTEYINLFKTGFLPKFSKKVHDYETSVYVTSPEYNVNFYDKMAQLKEKKGYTDELIREELGFLPEGILRLEVQCKAKHIYRLMEKQDVPSPRLGDLWNPSIAVHVLRGTVRQMIGEQDVYSLETIRRKLNNAYSYRTASRYYREIVHDLLHQGSLQSIKKSLGQPKPFHKLMDKIRKVGVNPIPLEAVAVKEICSNMNHLKNPYHLVQIL